MIDCRAMSTIALFDLDHTLIADDSDALWGRFLVEQGVLDSEDYEREKQRFLSEYRQGRLDIEEFIRFALAPYAAHDYALLLQWRERFVEEKMRPLISDAARALLDRHRDAGHVLLIVTATNEFLTRPIAELLEVEHFLATPMERINGNYTGRTAGPPCFREGKLFYLERWLEANEHDLEGSWFYSDSHNDLPLLERVSNPVAVNPDETLRRIAGERDWPVVSLHDTDPV